MPLPPTGWIIGHEYIGEVVEVGSGVKNFQPGDANVCCLTHTLGHPVWQ